MKKYSYSIILADPPWRYNNNTTRGAAEHHYQTMSMKELVDMRPMVDELASDDCVLFCWATSPLLPEALMLMSSWGFEYKTVGFTWVKQTNANGWHWGTGRYTRSNAEYCLLGTRGKPLTPISRSVHSIIASIPGEHSAKPRATHDRIEELYGDVPRIELFSRQETIGWDSYGNQKNKGTIPLF